MLLLLYFLFYFFKGASQGAHHHLVLWLLVGGMVPDKDDSESASQMRLRAQDGARKRWTLGDRSSVRVRVGFIAAPLTGWILPGVDTLGILVVAVAVWDAPETAGVIEAAWCGRKARGAAPLVSAVSVEFP